MGNTERTRSNNVELGVFESQTEKNEDIVRFEKRNVIVLKKQKKEAEKIFKNCDLRDLSDKQIEEFLVLGVNPNMENKDNDSILGWCVFKEKEGLVKKCLEMGADPNVKETFYDFENKKRISLTSPAFKLALFLLGVGCGIPAAAVTLFGLPTLALGFNFLNFLSVTAGTIVAISCNIFDAMILIASERSDWKIDWVDYEKKHYWKQSHLMTAVKNGNENIVKMLLEYGANPYEMDKNGMTPLAMADKKGHKGCYQLIESARNGCQLVGTTQHKLLGERKVNGFSDFEYNSFKDNEKMPITVARRSVNQQSTGCKNRMKQLDME